MTKIAPNLHASFDPAAAARRNVLDEHHSEPGFGGIDIPSMGRIFQLGLSQAY